MKDNCTKEDIEELRNAESYVQGLTEEALNGDKEASAELEKIYTEKDNYYKKTLDKIENAKLYLDGLIEQVANSDEVAIAELQEIYNKRDNLIKNLSEATSC